MSILTLTMSHSHDHPPTMEVRETELRRALEKAGWRYTRQRAAIFWYLKSVDSHPTAEQVFSAVRRQIPHLSLATVYKALEALVDAGLASKVPDCDGPVRYDGRHEEHYHFRCLDTGRVLDMPLPYDPNLLDKLAAGFVEELRSRGIQVIGHRLELIGHLRPPA